MKIPVTLEIDDAFLRTLAERLSVSPPVISGGEPDAFAEVELPSSWRLVEERHEVTYTWGEDTDVYDPFRIYEAVDGGVDIRLAIGRCKRTRTFGEDRLYYMVLAVGPSEGMRAVAEFLATDDYEETREVIAVIKGKGGSARLFDTAAELPSVYAAWPTVTYRDRVDYPRAYTKRALVCHERDHETMLNHAIAQVQLRRLDA